MPDSTAMGAGEGLYSHCRRVAAWSLALQDAAKGARVDELLEVAEAMDQHFAWEPYSDGEEPPGPAAAAALDCLRSSTAADLDHAIAALPVFPAAAQRALHVIVGDQWSSTELEAAASADQTLASQILAAANSWTGPSHGRIATISQAVTYIGASRTAQILYAASAKVLFERGGERGLWLHSLAAARAAETIATLTRSFPPKEAFLGGLVHDIGRLAMLMLPSAFQSRFLHLTAAGCEPFLVERVLSGFSHAQAGARALAGWKFPEPLVTGIEFHHQPEKTENKLASILYLMEYWADSREDSPSAARLKVALDRTGMNEADLRQLTLKDDRGMDGLR